MKNLIVPVIVIGVMLFIPLPALFVEIIFGVLLISSIIVLLIVQTKDIFPVFPKVSLVLTLLDLAAAISFTRIILTSKSNLILEQFAIFNIHFIINMAIAIIILILSLIFINRKVSSMSKVAACFILDSMTQRLFDIDSKQTSGMLTQEEAESQKSKVKSEADFFSILDGSTKFLSGNTKALCFIYFITLIGGVLISVYQKVFSLRDALNTTSFAALINLICSTLPLIILSICITHTIKKHMPSVSIKG